MEKLRFEKFKKKDWLLTNKQALLIHGGRMASVCYSNCHYDDCGDWVCGDKETD